MPQLPLKLPAVLLAAACLAPAAAAGAPAPSRVEVDLDGDGRRETVVMDPARDPALSVWRGKQRLHAWLPARWKPWKLLVGDVDGDGRREILVGVHKPTRFIPEPHHCLFVYGWNGRQAFPKWLGSSLGRPFSDFLLCDVDGDRADEVVALSGAPGRLWVVVYSWRGFGFASDREYGPWPEARLLKAEKGRVLVATPEGRVEIGQTAAGR